MSEENQNPVDWAKATEVELREAKEPWPKTAEDLASFIRVLAERGHDYGTCVYAMSLSAVAAFNYMAHVLGCTSFQASCADMDILRRTRIMKHGFQIIDYNNLLYPQYQDRLTISPESILSKPETRKRIVEQAKELLANTKEAHPDVLAHWKRLAAMAI